MKPRIVTTALLLLWGTGVLLAQTFRVDYIDGTVELQVSAGKWKPLDEGAKLSSADQVRLSNNGVAELSDGPVQIHLGRDGVYTLGPLMAEARKKPQQNLKTLVGDKLAKLVGAPSSSRVEVAQGGVRGAAQGDTDLQWATEDEAPAVADAAVPLQEQIKALMSEQKYPAALKAVGDGLASWKEERLTLLLLKAKILAAQGRSAAALKALSDPGFKRGQPGYMEYALLVGSQGIEAGEYDLVLAKTAEALEILPEAEIVQNLLLAQALAYQGKGNPTAAKDSLRRAAALDVTTPAGKEAQRLLATL